VVAWGVEYGAELACQAAQRFLQSTQLVRNVAGHSEHISAVCLAVQPLAPLHVLSIVHMQVGCGQHPAWVQGGPEGWGGGAKCEAGPSQMRSRAELKDGSPQSS
jgi:hypothetical protein